MAEQLIETENILPRKSIVKVKSEEEIIEANKRKAIRKEEIFKQLKLRTEAILLGFSGEQCNHCLNYKVLKTGNCLTCIDCGETTNCG